MKNTYLDELSKVDWMNRAEVLGRNLSRPIVELGLGIIRGSLPWSRCLFFTLVFQLLVGFHWDRWMFFRLGISAYYPRNNWCFRFYYFALTSLPFWTWAWSESLKKEKLKKILIEAFESSGLRNNLGKIPVFIFDKPVDDFTRKLRLTRAILPLSAFQKAKNALEGGLHIYIDEFRENRSTGTIDIIYSPKPMPEICKIADYEKVKPGTIFIGCTRAKDILANLNATPHFLIAGQTGGGKSTFTRQMAVTLYLNDPSLHMTIIDLKGSVESQLFEKLPRVDVPQTMKDAIESLNITSLLLEYRLKLFKANRCKDILEYFKIPNEKRISVPTGDGRVNTEIYRLVIIVDEAAEMFLAGDGVTGNDIKTGKMILSRIARQGRSIGVHLVIATQRPDSRALDPQIKANLTGTLCFQMVNDSSSILVLGNGRATDLPPTPGRAIWKSGMDMVEVQTPLLEYDEAETLLKFHYQATTSRLNKQNVQPVSDLTTRTVTNSLAE